MLGGLLGLGGSILGGIFNNKGTKGTNKTNLAIANQTNAANTLNVNNTNKANAAAIAATNAANTAKWKKELAQNWTMFKQGYHSPGENLQSTINMARKMGIHPLAALGGAQASSMPYSVPSAIPDQAAQSVAPQNQMPAPMVAPTGLGDSMSNAFAQLGSMLDAVQQKSNIDLTRAQTRRVMQDVPMAVAVRGSRSRSVLAAAKSGIRGGAVPIDGNPVINPKPPGAVRIHMPSGSPWDTSNSTNSQTVADEYGDLAQEVYGLTRLAHDAFMNAGQSFKKTGLPFIKKAWKAASQTGISPGKFRYNSGTMR